MYFEAPLAERRSSGFIEYLVAGALQTSTDDTVPSGRSLHLKVPAPVQCLRRAVKGSQDEARTLRHLKRAGNTILRFHDSRRTAQQG